MIHIPLHKATLESILETLNLNNDSFDASVIDSSDLLALTKRIEPNLDEIYNDFAVVSMSESELEWFTQGFTKGFDDDENPALFLMQRIKWGLVDRSGDEDEDEDGEVEIPGTPYDGDIEGYCVKCKDKRIIENCHISVSESGRKLFAGVCPICSTRMNKIFDS
jgi:hypothetical protein